jgi:hypothetical protein
MATAKRKKGTGSKRKKPGSTGKGEYYHIEVLPKTGFVTFRTHDVGDPGHIQRVAGKRASGSWATVKWLIGKTDAHIKGDKLVPNTKDAKELFKKLGTQLEHVKGDRFKAKVKPKTAASDTKTRAKTARSNGKTSKRTKSTAARAKVPARRTASQ